MKILVSAQFHKTNGSLNTIKFNYHSLMDDKLISVYYNNNRWFCFIIDTSNLNINSFIYGHFYTNSIYNVEQFIKRRVN